MTMYRRLRVLRSILLAKAICLKRDVEESMRRAAVRYDYFGANGSR